MTQALPRLIELIEQTPSMPKLRRLVFGPKTEKTRQLFLPPGFGQHQLDSSTSAGSTQPDCTPNDPKPKAKGAWPN